MNILIPLADGHPIPKAVMAGICSQPGNINVYVVSRPEPDPRNNYPHDRHAAQCENMNLLKKYASFPYTVYMDRDVVLTSDHDISDMASFLDAHEEYDAVALNTKAINCLEYKEKNKHVIVACMCVRTSSLDGYTFVSNGNECPCLDFNRRMKIKYLDNRRLHELR